MGRPPIRTCEACGQVVREHMQTLDEVYTERVQILIESDIELPEEVQDRALVLEDQLANGLSLSLSELQWLNSTLEKYGLE